MTIESIQMKKARETQFRKKITVAVYRTINDVLKRIGYQLVKINKDAENKDAENIDPLERNQRETLDKLWSDQNFKKNYLNQKRLKLYGEVRERAINEGLLNDGLRVIDVGCGPGFFLRFLEDKGFKGELIGCDFSDAAVENARKACPTGMFFVHDIYEEIGKRYNMLFCMETLEHLLRPDLALKILCKASERLLLTVPEGRKDSFRGHLNFWSKESFEVFLKTTLPEAKVKVDEFNQGRNLLAVIDLSSCQR